MGNHETGCRYSDKREEPEAGRRSWYPAVPPLPPAQMAERLRRHFAVAARTLIAVFVIGICLPGLTRAEQTDSEPQAGTLLLRMQSGYRVATRLNTDVAIRAAGLVARTTLQQKFVNDGPDWVEGEYVFPLPDGAAVDRLRMRIGERLIEGEIREREAAKKAYDDARREGRKASLVSQQRANLFTTSIANIAPGEQIVIEIEYLESIRYDDGTFSLRVPMTLTPRYIPGSPLLDKQGSGWSPDTTSVPDASLITPPVVASSAGHLLTLDARIDAGTPLELIASRYHPVRVSDEGNAYRVILADGNVSMDHDLELLWRPVPSAEPRARVFGETVQGQPHLLVMLLPPDIVAAGMPAPTRVLPRELVFVIDTSGSMHGVSIEQAKSALKLALEGLHEQDLFNVIQFNSVTSALFQRSMPARRDLLMRAGQYVDELRADGGTEMRPALERSLAGDTPETHLKQVVFITDGSVGNEVELFDVIAARLANARLFTVGIGSAPNGWFMRKAAAAGRGTYVTISAQHEVEEKIARLLRKLERPQLTDIRIEWPDSIEAEPYPAFVPDLYAGEPVLVRARLAREPRAGDQLRIYGRSNGGDWGADLPLSIATPAVGVAALWARARIESLTDAERRGADPETIRSAIIETALAHGLVSRHTSLVAVDRTPARSADAALRREQVPNLLPHGQDMRAIFGFPATATGAPAMRVAGSLAILAATILLMLRVWTGGGHVRAMPQNL